MEKINAKYVFLDVVSYTNRDIEAQSTIVEVLQKIVKDAIDDFDELDTWWNENVNFLPTGDGMCIVMENIDDPEDIHVQVGLKILSKLEKYNNEAQPSERFELRIGINENKDIVYTDINGRRNYAGRGINYAQRVMSFANKGQIFVGSIVYEKLADTRSYKNRFIERKVTLKNNQQILIYEYR